MINVGTLLAVLKLQDDFSGPIDRAGKGVTRFGDGMTAAVAKGQLMADAFEKGAELIIRMAEKAAAAVAELPDRGDKVADVADAFRDLAQAAGTDAVAALEAASRGTRGMIDDFELMQETNRAMRSGWRANAQDLELVGRAAKVLADSVGGEVKDAYTSLMDAMATGRTRGLTQNYGAMVELKGASSELAAALKAEGDEATTAASAEAKRGAVLDTVRAIVASAGKDEAGLADAYKQARVYVQNLWDTLSEAIERSPAIRSAIASIGEALVASLGSSKEEILTTLIAKVDALAIGAAKTGRTFAEIGGTIGGAWDGVSLLLDKILEKMGKITSFVGRNSNFFRSAVDQVLPGGGLAFDALTGGAAGLQGAGENMTREAQNSMAQTISSGIANEASRQKTIQWFDQLIAKMEQAAAAGVESGKKTVAAWDPMKHLGLELGTTIDGVASSFGNAAAAGSKAADELKAKWEMVERVMKEAADSLASFSQRTDSLNQSLGFGPDARTAAEQDAARWKTSQLDAMAREARSAEAAGAPIDPSRMQEQQWLIELEYQKRIQQAYEASLQASAGATTATTGLGDSAKSATQALAGIGRDLTIQMGRLGTVVGSGTVPAAPAGGNGGDMIPVFGAGGFLGYRKVGGFAEGGYADRPTLAIVGDSPGGEFMVPAQQAGGGGSPIYVDARESMFDSPGAVDRLAEKFAKAVEAKRRGRGYRV